MGPLLAFGVRRIVSSPAERCTATVAPLSAAIGRSVDTTKHISQDAWEEGRSDARTVIGERVRSRKPAVLCSHGPVLPDVLSELALATGTLRGSYLGSAFAVEPVLLQSAWMRPHNRSEDVANLYIAGAGTHPGAGLPGVMSSGKIVADLIGDAPTGRRRAAPARPTARRQAERDVALAGD